MEVEVWQTFSNKLKKGKQRFPFVKFYSKNEKDSQKKIQTRFFLKYLTAQLTNMPRTKKTEKVTPAAASVAPVVSKTKVPSPPEKLIKRVGEMLENLSGRAKYIDCFGKVNPDGICNVLGGLEDLTILLQRAHTKQVWEEDEKVWEHVDELAITTGKGEDLVKVGIHRDCSEYGDDGDPDDYDVDQEPDFCAVDAGGNWRHNADVQTTTTGTTADFYPYGYGKFRFDGGNSKSKGSRGYAHLPGDRCASQTIRGKTWDA